VRQPLAKKKLCRDKKSYKEFDIGGVCLVVNVGPGPSF